MGKSKDKSKGKSDNDWIFVRKSNGKSDNDDSDSTIVLSLLLQRQWR